jgi:hypothetical protein
MKYTIKVPRKLKLGVKNISTYFNLNLNIDENRVGQYSVREERIDILPMQPSSELSICYWHEWLHIIDRQYGCGIGEDNIDRMAHGLAEIVEKLGIELDWSDIKTIQD